MLMRPCFNSVWRRRLKFSILPSFVNPIGSQNPKGACTPSSDSKARRGDASYKAQLPHALPVRPSWKNMPIIAIIARRPLAISEFSPRSFFAGSATPPPLKIPRLPKVALPNPSSLPESLPAGSFGSCLAAYTSQKPQNRNHCAQPAAGTDVNAFKPFGMVSNFKASDGLQYPGKRKYSGTIPC